ncbi:hypothetical protein L1987_66984 [Smallanthus sonchifolius]|uniref:Uncharacterized protein n=1 Tax=Smallanthus sonchifolius TaxID=185202 RepID=A0ACB9BYZ4_9ASTR|nr:hypothetical protein L1987_66984 [Smallanthus sonchifolius]
MEEVCPDYKSLTNDERGEKNLPERREEKAELDGRNRFPEGKKDFVAPAVGMEFESYDDAYSYYNCYAWESGFRVRVKNSWFKRNSREKYGAVLCCSSQGFKRIKDVNHLRKETRTGCPAMVRLRLVDSRRWRILEVALDHNHLLGAKAHKSIKKTVQSDSDAEGRSVKLYKPLVIDSTGETPESYLWALKSWLTSTSGRVPQTIITDRCTILQKFHVDGPVIIFLVKERVLAGESRREIKDYEVLYDPAAADVRYGIEIHNNDGTDTIKRFNQLYRSALQVVEEGVISLHHYKVALQTFEECSSKHCHHLHQFSRSRGGDVGGSAFKSSRSNKSHLIQVSQCHFSHLKAKAADMLLLKNVTISKPLSRSDVLEFQFGSRHGSRFTTKDMNQ